jgi:hypothetical protein
MRPHGGNDAEPILDLVPNFVEFPETIELHHRLPKVAGEDAGSRSLTVVSESLFEPVTGVEIAKLADHPCGAGLHAATRWRSKS